jgi:hypothetical protein
MLPSYLCSARLGGVGVEWALRTMDLKLGVEGAPRPAAAQLKLAEGPIRATDPSFTQKPSRLLSPTRCSQARGSLGREGTEQPVATVCEAQLLV